MLKHITPGVLYHFTIGGWCPWLMKNAKKKDDLHDIILQDAINVSNRKRVHADKSFAYDTLLHVCKCYLMLISVTEMSQWFEYDMDMSHCRLEKLWMQPSRLCDVIISWFSKIRTHNVRADILEFPFIHIQLWSSSFQFWSEELRLHLYGDVRDYWA